VKDASEGEAEYLALAQSYGQGQVYPPTDILDGEGRFKQFEDAIDAVAGIGEGSQGDEEAEEEDPLLHKLSVSSCKIGKCNTEFSIRKAQYGIFNTEY